MICFSLSQVNMEVLEHKKSYEMSLCFDHVYVLVMFFLLPSPPLAFALSIPFQYPPCAITVCYTQVYTTVIKMTKVTCKSVQHNILKPFECVECRPRTLFQKVVRKLTQSCWHD